MKSDKDVQLNRGRCVYRSKQRQIVIDEEEEIIQDGIPVEKDSAKTIDSNAEEQDGLVNKEITP